MDEYKKYFKNTKEKEQEILENPIWHIHEGHIPRDTYPIEFSTLINLVTALNTYDEVTINNFCLLYIKGFSNATEQNSLQKITKLAYSTFKTLYYPRLKEENPI